MRFFSSKLGFCLEFRAELQGLERVCTDQFSWALPGPQKYAEKNAFMAINMGLGLRVQGIVYRAWGLGLRVMLL